MKKLILLVFLTILTLMNYFIIPKKQIISLKNNYLNIERISLKQNIYSYKESSVDQNIIFLKESNFQDDFYILAAHSGNSRIAFFKNLHKINKNDVVKMNIKGKEMKFIVEDKYYIKKTGNMKISRGLKNVLYLTTCDKFNEKRQLVIKCVKQM